MRALYPPIQFVESSFIFMPTLVRNPKFLTISRTRIIHWIAWPCCILKISRAILQVLVIRGVCATKAQTSLKRLLLYLHANRTRREWKWRYLTGANRLRAKRGKTVLQIRAIRCVGITGQSDDRRNRKTLAAHEAGHSDRRICVSLMARWIDDLTRWRVDEYGNEGELALSGTSVPCRVVSSMVSVGVCALVRPSSTCALPSLDTLYLESTGV